MVSGRGGAMTPQVVKHQAQVLKRIFDKLDKLGSKRSPVAAVDKLAEPMLKEFRAPTARYKQYAQRLKYGLHHYYIRNYLSSSRQALDE